MEELGKFYTGTWAGANQEGEQLQQLASQTAQTIVDLKEKINERNKGHWEFSDHEELVDSTPNFSYNLLIHAYNEILNNEDSVFSHVAEVYVQRAAIHGIRKAMNDCKELFPGVTINEDDAMEIIAEEALKNAEIFKQAANGKIILDNSFFKKHSIDIYRRSRNAIAKSITQTQELSLDQVLNDLRESEDEVIDLESVPVTENAPRRSANLVNNVKRLFARNQDSTENIADENRVQDKFWELIKTTELTNAQKHVYFMHICNMNSLEIGRKLGISNQRVSQLITRAQKKLLAKLKSDGIASFDDI